MVLIPHGDTFRVREARWNRAQQKKIDEKRKREYDCAFAMMDRYEQEHGLRLLKDDALAKLEVLNVPETQPRDPDEGVPLNPLCGFSHLDPIFRPPPDPTPDLRFGGSRCGSDGSANSDTGTLTDRRTLTARGDSATPGLTTGGRESTTPGPGDGSSATGETIRAPKGATFYGNIRGVTPLGYAGSAPAGTRPPSSSRPRSRSAWSQRPHSAPSTAIRSTRAVQIRNAAIQGHMAEVNMEQEERLRIFELQWRQNREEERTREMRLKAERERELDKFHTKVAERERAALMAQEPFAVRRASQLGGTTTPSALGPEGTSRPGTAMTWNSDQLLHHHWAEEDRGGGDPQPIGVRSGGGPMGMMPPRSPTPGEDVHSARRSTTTRSRPTSVPASGTRSAVSGRSRPGSAGSALLPYQIFSDVAYEADSLEVEADLRRFEQDFTRVVVKRQGEQKTSLSKRFSRPNQGAALNVRKKSQAAGSSPGVAPHGADFGGQDSLHPAMKRRPGVVQGQDGGAVKVGKV